ncbi:hypothetical protein AAS23_gp75 [Pantoea phage vB_PagS_AAS23]|uniref:Ead/Ea22-like family protein n=1 Tax=Pantoea phage vB_PagS_AAS23 TaxID=2499073 RepID=A0A3S9U7Z3_9CAUD|nr:hypothetical protein HOU93_gp75 [Pantoea phage vB_PagS_AAS23]AZS06388.1 hypothetical protein AAS23_gp75 [Pantoea phage vB_PagS_AAS23]
MSYQHRVECEHLRHKLNAALQRAEAAEAALEVEKDIHDDTVQAMHLWCERAKEAEAKLAELESQKPYGYINPKADNTVQEFGWAGFVTPVFTRPAPAADLAGIVPEKASMADYYENVRSGEIDPEEAGIAMWDACRATILRNIEDAGKKHE